MGVETGEVSVSSDGVGGVRLALLLKDWPCLTLR